MSKKISGIIITLFFFSSLTNAQLIYDWEVLSNAPVPGSRINDAYFVNTELGWVCNGNGIIWRTTNGGLSWVKQFEKSNAHLRSIGFLNDSLGFSGNVGAGEFSATDTTALYKTTNSGISWQPFNNFSGTKPVGLCGMFVLNDSTIFSVGRVRGPAFFTKTTDGGNTWISTDMDSYAAGLIDCYFFTPDSGYAVGLTSSTHSQSRGIVLFTSDGGESWDTSFVSSRTGEWCWKMSFPTKNTGYVSLQRNSGGAAINIIKTTNGGESWFEKEAFDFHYFVQGIGFINDSTGWIGGNSQYPVYQTTDGGDTWEESDFGTRVNRFRFINDTVGYAVGETVYKLQAESVTNILAEDGSIPNNFNLYQNYPNPFNPETKITYLTNSTAFVSLKVFDLLGNEITTLVNEEKFPGKYDIIFNGKNLSSGIYFYRLNIGSEVITKNMVLLK